MELISDYIWRFDIEFDFFFFYPNMVTQHCQQMFITIGKVGSHGHMEMYEDMILTFMRCQINYCNNNIWEALIKYKAVL